MNDQYRGSWSSNMGLVLAATGSAIGLGNLWKRGGPRNWDSLLRWDPDQGEGVWA